MEKEGENECMKFLQELKVKKRKYEAFKSSLKTLQSYAANKGLQDHEMDLLADVIMNSDLGAVKLVSLVKCLVPRYKLKRTTLKSIVTWWLASVDHLPVTVSAIVVQWLIGVLDQQLACCKTVNLFYSVFFHVMLKKEKLQRQLARLIYVIMKPEDVTRRNTTRLLNLHRKYSRQQNHIVALLSLFKSCKPELVPEKILSVNIESAWKPIPEPLRLMLVEAKARNDRRTEGSSWEESKWTTFAPEKAKKNTVPLLPSVVYFQIGSGIFEQKRKSIFEISSVEDLGREELNVQLPCNAVSLLLNHAGYHLLTFADFDYQSRFSYNLYNTLIRAFILEPEKCPPKEAANLLELTAEFSRYLQQGVPVVARFLDEYLYLNSGKHQSELLALLQWITSVSLNDLRKILTHLQNMFVESSLPSKIEIIRTLKNFVTNLFVNQGLEPDEESAALFLRQDARMENFEEAIEIVIRLAGDLIVFGLTAHSLNLLLLAEALSFYEAISTLESRSRVSLFTIPPAAVIYSCFITKNCATLCRVCELLLRYRKRSLSRKNQLNVAVIDTIRGYAKNIITALWHDKPFKTRKDNDYFLCNVPQHVLDDLKYCDMDSLLNICNHYAVLPYKILLRRLGLNLRSEQDTMVSAVNYYPTIFRLFDAFRGGS